MKLTRRWYVAKSLRWLLKWFWWPSLMSMTRLKIQTCSRRGAAWAAPPCDGDVGEPVGFVVNIVVIINVCVAIVITIINIISTIKIWSSPGVAFEQTQHPSPRCARSYQGSSAHQPPFKVLVVIVIKMLKVAKKITSSRLLLFPPETVNSEKHILWF